MNKRAMSEVVTIVLLVSFVLIMVGVVFALVINLKDDVLMAPKKCLDFTISQPVKIQEACFNSSSQEVIVTLFRERQDPEISKLGFVFETEEGSEKFTCSDFCGNCEILKTSQQKRYFIQVNNSKKLTFLINDCLIKSVDLTPCAD